MLDPTDYDPDELRTLAGVPTPESPERPDWEGPSEFLGRAAAQVQAAQLGDLYYLSAAMDGATRPYLPDLPTAATGARLALDWLEFLVSVAGRDGAERALSYYRRIEWVGDAAHDTLVSLLPGLDPGGADRLTPGHHRTSLVFIARLAAVS